MKKILSDDEIIELFFARNDLAINEISAAYGAYLSSIASNILKNKEDCNECLNDVYLLLWNHIPPEKPHNLRAYAAKIVRNAALRLYQSKARRGFSESLPIDELADQLENPQSVETEYDAQQLKAAMNRYVLSLSETDQYIFVCRYYDSDSISVIAHSLHLSEKTIYKRLAKIRSGLAKELRKEGFPC